VSYRIAITTLGCKVNQADSEHLAQAFAAAGCDLVEPEQAADAYVLNTCTVTLVADRKARKLVRALARRRAGAVVAVTGCYAEGLGRAVLSAMPEVDLLRGTADRETLPQAVLLELRRRRALGLLPPLDQAPAAAAPRVRAMLKVQDGCSHVCRFCIVPAVRGGLRSRPAAEVLDEARGRAAAGVRELVLCGIRLGAYGWDFERGGTGRGSRFRPLQDLVSELAEVGGLARLRLSSILPLDVGPDLFRRLAELAPVCPHLHLPLQAGDDNVLRAMGRGYTTRRFAQLAEAARAAWPDVALATDVLVGYPGESRAQFERTVAFCRAVGFADMHVFAYSPRPGTPAAALVDDVEPAEKEDRSARLHAVRDELRASFRRPRLGQTAQILVEQAGPSWCQGLTPDYVRVRAAGAAPLGELATVRLTALDGEQMVGELAADGQWAADGRSAAAEALQY
jgi:threonylcarbamoyladenosine tRNA methylthiotransferase MtaB